MKILSLLFVVLLAPFNAEAQPGAKASPPPLQIEVTIPALVTAGQEFPLVYRTTPTQSGRLQKEFQTKSKTGALGKGRISGEILTGSRRLYQAVIEAPGYYLLTFEFETGDGQKLSANARTKVLDAANVTPFAGTAWELPRKNIYLAPEKFASWNQTPAPKREILGLERTAFSPLLEQPDYDDSWYPLRAWNQMAELLQPRFLPPLSFVHAFKNTSYLPVRYVAYATWSQAETNFVYQTEIGGKSWLYIETPASKPAADLKTIFQVRALPSMLTRSFSRYRALNSEAQLEAVNVWLIQIEPPAGLNLLFPGYRAPEIPRFAAPANP